MPAFTLSGRLSAIALFLALPAALSAQQFATTVQPSAESAASAAGNTNSSVSVENSPATLTDEKWGDSLMARKEYQSAIDAYARVSQPPAGVWNKMGMAYQMLFDEKNAARSYRECLKLDPNNPHALNNLATIDDVQQDFSAAERLYRQALKLNPGSARLIKNLATNLLLQHRYRESSEAYAQALAIDPHILDRDRGPIASAFGTQTDRGEMSYVQARSCARAGLIDCAIDHLRRAFDQGFATRRKVAKEDDFAGLRQMPQFTRLLAEQK